jgi:hypothetical protein
VTTELLESARKVAPRVAAKLRDRADEAERQAERHLTDAFEAARTSATLGDELSWVISVADAEHGREIRGWTAQHPANQFVEALRSAQQALDRVRQVRARRIADRERAREVLRQKADERLRRAEAEETADAEEREREAAARAPEQTAA